MRGLSFDKEIIKELLQEVSDYRVIRCELKHEKVVGEGAAYWDSTGQEVHKTYKRIGLCLEKIRKSVIGCAHSPTNSWFSKLLSKAVAVDVGLEPLRVEFDKVITQIYLMDHKKGSLEKQLFCASSSQKEEVAIQINNLVCRHNDLIDQLSEIQKLVISRLSEKLENYTK